MPIYFQTLTSSEIDLLPKESSVIFIPIGILEAFGPHLPINTSIQIAEAMAYRTALKLQNERPGFTSIISATLPFGIDSNTRQKSYAVRGHVLRDAVIDFTKNYSKLGFKYFATVSHLLSPKQLTALEESGKFLSINRFTNSGVKLFSLSSGLVTINDFFRSPLFPDESEHGGHRDVSMMLAINPQAVKSNYKFLPEQTRSKSKWQRWHQYLLKSCPEYWGNPSSGSADMGEKILKDTSDILFQKLSLILDGVSQQKILRSWYSVIPFNKSFFRGWLLASGIFLLFVTWMIVLFKGLLGGL